MANVSSLLLRFAAPFFSWTLTFHRLFFLLFLLQILANLKAGRGDWRTIATKYIPGVRLAQHPWRNATQGTAFVVEAGWPPGA